MKRRFELLTCIYNNNPTSMWTFTECSDPVQKIDFNQLGRKSGRVIKKLIKCEIFPLQTLTQSPFQLEHSIHHKSVCEENLQALTSFPHQDQRGLRGTIQPAQVQNRSSAGEKKVTRDQKCFTLWSNPFCLACVSSISWLYCCCKYKARTANAWSKLLY